MAPFPTRGTMRPIKVILGILLLVAGLGIIFVPETMVPILCSNQFIFGLVISMAGYLFAISGRQL